MVFIHMQKGKKLEFLKREWSEKLECEIYEEEKSNFLEVINVIKNQRQMLQKNM